MFKVVIKTILLIAIASTVNLFAQSYTLDLTNTQIDTALMNGYYLSDSLDARDARIYWDDLRFPIQNLKVSPVSNKPDFDSANVVYLMDKASTEMVLGVAQMPHEWISSSDIHPHVHWGPATNAGGTVYWRLEYKIADIDGNFPALWTADTMAVESDTVALKHQIDEFETIDMASYTTVSTIILWRVSRLGAEGGDDLDADARLYEFDIHFQTDGRGSRQETVK